MELTALVVDCGDDVEASVGLENESACDGAILGCFY
jgi:hypothetical protein